MVIGMVIAEGAADPGRGWGNMLGLAAGGVACWAIWRYDLYRRQRMNGKGGNPSPTPGASPAPHETRQVTAVSSHSSHETAMEGGDEWYGRIVRRGNRIVRVAKHVVRTGESPPESEEEPDPDTITGELLCDGEPALDDDIDLPLDGDIGQWEDAPEEEPEERSALAPAKRQALHRESREEYARRCLREGVTRAAVTQGLQDHYGLSRATAYRLVGRLASQGRAA